MGSLKTTNNLLWLLPVHYGTMPYASLSFIFTGGIYLCEGICVMQSPENIWTNVTSSH